MSREFRVKGCGSNNSVGVIRQSYGLGVYGPRSEVKEGDMVAACKCCPEVRYLSATVEWHGYERFVCEGDDPIDPADRDRTKYLTYTTNGAAQISDCSGSTNHFKANEVQSWFIDPFTGLTNYSGPGTQNVSYLCGSGDTCSLTQKQGTCTISGDDPCTAEEETERTVTFTETLSWDYLLADVAGKIDEAVGRLDLYSESQGIPDGTVGFLENGTGHSIVRLSPAQNAYVSCGVGCPDQLNALWVETYNPTTRQWFVTKQYIYIKFKSRTEYKMYRKDLTTGEIKESEETDSGEKIIKADKLNEEVWVTVSSGNQFFLCGEGSKCSCSTMAGCEDTGRKIYKQSATTCSPLIGPDCQQYFSSMGTEVTSGTVFNFNKSTFVDDEDSYTIGSTETKSYRLISSIQTNTCPLSSVVYLRESENTRGSGELDPELQGQTSYSYSFLRTVSDNSETITEDTETSASSATGNYGNFGRNACPCQQSLAEAGQEGGTATSLCTTTIRDATVTTVSSHDYSFSETIVEEQVTDVEQVERHSTSKVTTVWANPVDAAGLQTVSDEINYTNTAWLETGFNALGRYYVSKADVKKACEVKFTACETNQADPPVDYEVLLHCAKRTFNQKDPDNPILTWEVDNQRKNVSSKGGPESKEFDIEIPTPGTDKTVASLAYSTCTVWKKPN